jgi:hypothetical protein
MLSPTARAFTRDGGFVNGLPDVYTAHIKLNVFCEPSDSGDLDDCADRVTLKNAIRSDLGVRHRHHHHHHRHLHPRQHEPLSTPRSSGLSVMVLRQPFSECS